MKLMQGDCLTYHCAEGGGRIMTKKYRKYPIIGTNPQEYIPWDILAPHETQAEINHGGQSLERLAQRGGLSWQEVYAIINDKTWKQIQISTTLEAKNAVLECVAAWEAKKT